MQNSNNLFPVGQYRDLSGYLAFQVFFSVYQQEADECIIPEPLEVQVYADAALYLKRLRAVAIFFI